MELVKTKRSMKVKCEFEHGSDCASHCEGNDTNFEGRREGVEVRMTDEPSSRTYLCAQGYGRSQPLAKGSSSADKCLFPAEVPVTCRRLTNASPQLKQPLHQQQK